MFEVFFSMPTVTSIGATAKASIKFEAWRYYRCHLSPTDQPRNKEHYTDEFNAYAVSAIGYVHRASL